MSPVMHTCRSAAALLCSLVPLSAASGARAQTAPDATATLDVASKLDRYLGESGFTGLALVAKDGKILLERAYGLADREHHVPLAIDALVSIGSITKQFTAAAILRLEMEGKLKVEDPITRFFTDVPEDKRAITLHQLLTHTAGLDSDFAGDYEPVGRDEYVKRILASKLRSAPGKEHFYANSGYSLLGAIVEIASKQTYETYLQKHLFEPARMHETGYCIPKWEKSRAPVGYRDGERWGTMLEKPWAEDGPYWALRANGGIESTLDDLFNWSRALDGELVLTTAEKQKLFARHVAEGPRAESFYGYGWSISTTPWGKTLVEHDGGNGVFSADFRRYVDDGIVVITFSNDSRVKAWKFAGPLARIARGEDVKPEPKSANALPQLGDSARHAAIRAFVDAFNTNDIEHIHKFRAEHMVKRTDGPSESERDRVAQRMFDEMRKLALDGVIGEDKESVTVRMTTASGEKPSFRFEFDAQDKVAGLRIEAGG